MPLDPSLEELAGQSQMTHWPDQPNPVRNFIDYAQQPAQPRAAMPGEERINQALTRQLPGYTPTQPPPQQNWQRWTEEALSNLPFGGLGTLRMARIAPGEKRITVSNFGGKDEWSLWSKETGKKLGEMYTNYDKDTNQLKVEYMTGDWSGSGIKHNLNEPRSWTIGTHELQTLRPEILREYPNIDTLKLTRIGGVFKESPVTLTYKRVDTPEGAVFRRIKIERSGPGWVPPTQRFQPGRPTAQPPSAQSPPPAPPAPPTEEPLQHGPGWTREREESWDAMRQRQDAEWAALMQRLFGR